MANFYQVTKNIGGKDYVAQFNGISAALEAVDNSYIDGSGNISLAKLSKYLFENVIVEPKGLTSDDFESLEEFNEVVAFAREVMQATFEANKTKKQLTQRVRNNWGAWRLVLAEGRGFDYVTVFYKMTPQQIQEANIALDMQLKAEKQAMKRK